MTLYEHICKVMGRLEPGESITLTDCSIMFKSVTDDEGQALVEYNEFLDRPDTK